MQRRSYQAMNIVSVGMDRFYGCASSSSGDGNSRPLRHPPADRRERGGAVQDLLRPGTQSRRCGPSAGLGRRSA
ncbi:MAG: hypothetical protein ACYDHX_00935 [Methanothrix sp.]